MPDFLLDFAHLEDLHLVIFIILPRILEINDMQENFCVDLKLKSKYSWVVEWNQ